MLYDYIYEKKELKLSGGGSAILYTTLPCPGGGNTYSQYLIINKENHSYVVEELNIGDKAFNVSEIKNRGDLILLIGEGWANGSCHACADIKDTLIYNVKTKRILKNYEM